MTGRRGLPSLRHLTTYWSSWADVYPAARFPAARIATRDIGEPMCFRCGWLAPVPDSAWFRGCPPGTASAFYPDSFDQSGQYYAQHRNGRRTAR
jgi:hypothetical protein